MLPVLRVGVADDGVGDGHLPLAADQIGARPVAGKIVEPPGPVQTAQLLAAEMPFNPPQGQAAHIAHVDPGPQNHQHMGVAQLGHGFRDVKFADSHN